MDRKEFRLHIAIAWVTFALNVAAALVFVYLAYTLFNDPPSGDAANRNWVDVIVSCVFLVGAVFWLPTIKRAYIDARYFEDSATYETLNRKPYSMDGYVPKVYSQTPEVDAYVRDKTAVLIKHGVITQVEYDAVDFDEILGIDEWDANITSYLSFLDNLTGRHAQVFKNLTCRTDQVETPPENYAYYFTKFAQMLGLRDQPQNLDVVDGEDLSTLSFDYAGTRHSFDGKMHVKYFCWDIIIPVVQLLEQDADGKRLCILASDMSMAFTALEPDQLTALNADFCDGPIDEYDRFAFVTKPTG